jgi:hypothetical protein
MEGQKIKKIERKFGEITSNQDFHEKCISYKKGCAIGLLPAAQHSEYERENFEEHVSILKSINDKAVSDPIFYSWVNTTCHPEWLQYFDVDQFALPTVVFYYPEKELQSNLIGKFDNSTISEQLESYMKGKLPTWKPKVTYNNMKM